MSMADPFTWSLGEVIIAFRDITNENPSVTRTLIRNNVTGGVLLAVGDNMDAIKNEFGVTSPATALIITRLVQTLRTRSQGYGAFMAEREPSAATPDAPTLRHVGAQSVQSDTRARNHQAASSLRREQGATMENTDRRTAREETRTQHAAAAGHRAHAVTAKDRRIFKEETRASAGLRNKQPSGNMSARQGTVTQGAFAFPSDKPHAKFTKEHHSQQAFDGVQRSHPVEGICAYPSERNVSERDTSERYAAAARERATETTATEAHPSWRNTRRYTRGSAGYQAHVPTGGINANFNRRRGRMRPRARASQNRPTASDWF